MNQELRRRNNRGGGERSADHIPVLPRSSGKTDGPNGAPETPQDPSAAKNIFLSNPGQKVDD